MSFKILTAFKLVTFFCVRYMTPYTLSLTSYILRFTSYILHTISYVLYRVAHQKNKPAVS